MTFGLQCGAQFAGHTAGTPGVSAVRGSYLRHHQHTLERQQPMSCYVSVSLFFVVDSGEFE